MNVPIRMLGIANLIFWIVLIGFIASAGYSIKDINVSMGETQYVAAEDGNLAITFPLHIDNRGYYGLKAFNITTSIYGEHKSEITRTSTFVPTVLEGRSTTILHNITLNIGEIAQSNPQLLINDSSLHAQMAAGFDFAELMPVQFSTNLTFPWGAPFSNLRVGQPQYAILSRSDVRATVPLSFENHAPFDIAGEILARLYDSQGRQLAESAISLLVPSGSNYVDNLSFSLPVGIVSDPSSMSGHVEFFFSTPLFEYGPVVVNYG